MYYLKFEIFLADESQTVAKLIFQQYFVINHDNLTNNKHKWQNFVFQCLSMMDIECALDTLVMLSVNLSSEIRTKVLHRCAKVASQTQ